MKLKISELKPVGGFFRYGFALYPFSDHDLHMLANMLALGPVGISSLVRQTEEIVSRHSGGFNLVAGEVILRDSLIVVRALDNSWLAAYATSEDIFLKWLHDDAVLTHIQYLKEKEAERKEKV